MIMDLHQDISVRLLELGVDKFFFPKKIDEKIRTYGKYGLIDQVDYLQLQKSGYKIILGSSCALKVTKQGIILPQNPLYELLCHVNSYKKLVKMSSGQISIVKNVSDLQKKTKYLLKIILSIEGLYFIQEKKDINLINNLYDLGIRVIGPFWNIHNTLGGGGKNIQGLTQLGKGLIEYLNQKNIIIDGSHASPPALKDIIHLSKKPIIVSHALSKTVTNHYRNLEDSDIKSICKKNGVIGICFIKDFAGGNSISFIIKHIKYITKIGSINNIAIGSDFGAMSNSNLIKDYETASDIYKLRIELKKNGFSSNDIKKIMYKNAFTFFKDNLPN